MSNEFFSTADVVWDGGYIKLRTCRYGPMLFLSSDRYIGRSLDMYGEFSEGEMALLRQIIRRGQCILDIGANVGVHTVFFASQVGDQGSVHAFEPQRMLFHILCGNLALGGHSNTQALLAGVGKECGKIAVPNLDVTLEQNFGGLSLGDVVSSNVRTENVQVVTIDALELPACHLVKLDVEGMEGDVIAGARRTICRHRPALYVENDRKDRSAALIEQLFALDYRLYWHLPPMFRPNNFRGVHENIFGNVVSVNMLGLHRDFPQQVNGLPEVIDPNEDWQQVAHRIKSGEPRLN